MSLGNVNEKKTLKIKIIFNVHKTDGIFTKKKYIFYAEVL